MVKVARSRRKIERWALDDHVRTRERGLERADDLISKGYHAKVVYEPGSDEADEGRPYAVYYKDR